ncbi:MAG TPA: alpha/beta hydrolase [Pseudonocardiaceae bacterium]|jgi:alpha-beta hydrolase superfamily lysophospholipase|nr:alpha/beta hydrolase [Pseudonocardiaceae bacterium]
MTDPLFGERSTVRTIQVSPDASGPAVATLVRVPAEVNTRGAVLIVHGFVDYFFHTELADHLRGNGFDVYGLDLRAYGRSLLEHQLPNYVTDLAMHFEELDEAARLIHDVDGHRRLTVVGHSTGGLVTALWANRAPAPLDALVLNSPWLDLAEPWFMRTVGTAAVRVLGRFAPRTVVRAGLGTVYGESLRHDHHGEWDYNLEWKPLNGFPVRAGWLRAIRAGHRAVRAGLDIPVPVLVLHSARSLLHGRAWTPAAMSADTVLDVAQIARRAPKLGRHVRTVVVAGGLHDVFLSAPDVRAAAMTAMDGWLDEQVPHETSPAEA